MLRLAFNPFFYAPKWNTVSIHYSNAYSYYSYSRLITIYERFDVKSLKEGELGTIKGKLTDKNGNAIAYATIVIDGFRCGYHDDVADSTRRQVYNRSSSKKSNERKGN
jgi:hypothetical protein